MRAINKGPEPRSLIEHRAKTHSDYDNYTDKDGLREALEREQRGLCCYCMNRIRADSETMKIEHWQSQVCHRDRRLDYSNLLGACLGGEGQLQRLQHCDTRKRDNDLQWNPADPSHQIETRLRYEPDGSIRSDDPTFDAQLHQVLNLNLAVLKNNRKGVLDAVLRWWRQERERAQGPVPRGRFLQERDQKTGGEGALQPYCQVAVWWLDQRLKSMPA